MAWLYQAQTTTKGIQLGNEEWGHTLAIGTNWTKLRVGARIALSHYQSFDGSPLGTLLIGMCQGTAAMFKASNCTEFIGFRLSNSTVTTYTFATSPGLHFSNTRPDFISKVGPNITVHTGFSAAEYIGGSTSVRTMVFVDLQKNGGSSITMTVYIPGNTTQGTTDNGMGNFIQSMENNTTPLNCGTLGPTVCTHPGAGLLDTIYFGWNKAMPPITLFDFAAARIW